jgi:hypothetical protein
MNERSQALDAMAYKQAPNTGILYNADQGFGSTFEGSSSLPRSIASDGRRSVLILHVLVHVLALTSNIVSCVYMWDDFTQVQMQTGATVAAVMHGIGILSLLSLAASEVKQIAFVVSLSVIYTFLWCGLVATATMASFTFRSDDVLTEPHWLYYITIFLQILGISLLTACSLNMAAHGDLATDPKAPPAAVQAA